MIMMDGNSDIIIATYKTHERAVAEAVKFVLANSRTVHVVEVTDIVQPVAPKLQKPKIISLARSKK